MSIQEIVFGSEPQGNEYKPLFSEPILAVLDVDPKVPANERWWAVYVGPKSKGTEFILLHGTKLKKEFAQFLFPNISGHYRD
jgi:hypothetical protein